MRNEGRAAARQRERCQLRIKGVDANGLAFEEEAELRDINEEGLSFYLNRPLWLNSHVSTEIVASQTFPPHHIASAMVVRIQSDASGKQLIAARFNE